jgi:deoxyribonuclease-4
LKKLPLLGAHVSVAGGVYNAPGLGLACGCDVIQIFARYPTRWETPDLGSEDVEKFKRAQEKTGVHAVATHASYLINLASSSPSLYERSIEAMAEEMKRAAMLGIENVVVHPGSAKDKDFDGAISRVAGAMRDLADGIDGAHICLETTAGQGTSVGYRLSHIGEIIERSGCAERMYVCLDSCHLYAAGYDISAKEGFERLTAELKSLGLTEKVRVIHLNDSRRELGSRVDRHEHIGEGMIGLQGFSHLLNHPPFRDVPFILETPKGDDPIKSDSDNLYKLRKLIKKRRK